MTCLTILRLGTGLLVLSVGISNSVVDALRYDKLLDGATYLPTKICPVAEYLKSSNAATINTTFYAKYLDVDGVIPILASSRVPDEALVEAAKWIRILMQNLPLEATRSFAKYKVREVVMAKTERTTDVPEHSSLIDLNWARGLGATESVPVTSSAEENLLQYGAGQDPYASECILIHEFAHTLWDTGIQQAYPDWHTEFLQAYQEAHASGKYKGFYADTNHHEYWAEGTQSWFDCASQNPVNTRAGIKAFDPPLARILERVYGAKAPIYQKPNLQTLRESLKQCQEELNPVQNGNNNSTNNNNGTRSGDTSGGNLTPANLFVTLAISSFAIAFTILQWN